MGLNCSGPLICRFFFNKGYSEVSVTASPASSFTSFASATPETTGQPSPLDSPQPTQCKDYEDENLSNDPLLLNK